MGKDIEGEHKEKEASRKATATARDIWEVPILRMTFLKYKQTFAFILGLYWSAIIAAQLIISNLSTWMIWLTFISTMIMFIQVVVWDARAIAKEAAQ